jgi:putative transposase
MSAGMWVSAQQLAGLPGMPKTDRGVRIAAASECWESRDKARGKGLEYAVGGLPAETRKALQAAKIQGALTEAGTEAVAAPISVVVRREEDLTDAERLARDARNGVKTAIRRMQEESGCSQSAAMTTLLTVARAGRVEPTLDKMLRLARDTRGRAGDGYPSERTLKRWLSASDLTPKHPRKDDSVPAWAPSFLSFWQQPQKPSVEDAYRRFVETLPSNERPSIHQVRRFLTRLGAVTRERGRMGPRELKNIRPFVRRDFSLLEPNDVWTADGHTFDAEVQHPFHGRPFRPEITTFIDIATRRAVGWSVDLAESTFAVADALRYGVEREGIPALIYVDNGSGYRNAAMSDEATGLVGRIGSTITHSIPYNSQARGVIERSHQTIWIAGAKLLPSFIGAAMDREARLQQFKLTRRALKQGGAMPLMPWDLFVQFAEQRIAEYNARPHRSLKGLSPDMCLAGFKARDWKPDMVSEEMLKTLFRPRVKRTLARAEIQLFNNRYYARELEEFHGSEVHISYDIHDASKIWVYLPDGRLLATAEVNGNRKHYFPVPVVEQAKQKRAKARLGRIDEHREEVLAELNGSPAISVGQTSTVVIGGRVIQPEEMLAAQPVLVEDSAEILPKAIPTLLRKSPEVPRSSRSAAENHSEWAELSAAAERGEVLSTQDARFLESWPKSSQGRTYLKRTA